MGQNNKGKIFQLKCKNPDCNFTISTSGDPTALQKRLFDSGCPCCSGREFSANYETSDFDSKEVAISDLSVIIPFYGVETFAKDCIESVLRQDVNSMDVYLVDDGSKDKCHEICDSFLFDPRVIVIHKKNAGLSMARNTALEFIHSEYVTFVDGDDKLLDNFSGYSRIIAALSESGADLAYFGYVLHKEGEEPRLPESLSGQGYSLMDKKESLDFFFDRVETIYCSAVWNKMVKSSLFSSARYVPGVYCQDLRMMPNLLRQTNSSVTINETMVSYLTQRKGAITRSINPKLIFDRMMAVKDCLDFAKETGNHKYIEITAKFFAKYLVAAYYAAWKGISPDPEERKKQINLEYMRTIKAAFREEKNIILSKTYISEKKKRFALRMFGLSRYAFVAYNRISKSFDL